MAFLLPVSFTQQGYGRNAIISQPNSTTRRTSSRKNGKSVGRTANFLNTKFARPAKFIGTKFREVADFGNATFSGDADFAVAEFNGNTRFDGTTFTQNVDFNSAKFFSRTLFASRKEDGKIVQIFPATPGGPEIDFTDVIIKPPDAIIFRDADLTRCRFLCSDLRKAEFVGVTWPKMIFKWWPESWSRFGVYDEIDTREKSEAHSYPHVEELYRQLKQNYEDRRHYARAADFNYGEKEMWRKAETTPGLRVLLTLYWLVSAYGERFLRPLVWMVIILAVSTFCYLNWGLLNLKDSDAIPDWSNLWETGLYSLQVMILLKPTYFEPGGFCGRFIYTLQSISGPVLLGLFALAVRQRLKR